MTTTGRLMLAFFALIATCLFVGFTWLLFPLAITYFGHRILRAVEQRPTNDLNAMSLRLLRVEERVEQIAAETERISDGLRFTTTLLAGTRTR